MDSTPTENADRDVHQGDGSRPFPAFVDWILGAIVALSGLLTIVSGSALSFFVDRAVLAAVIEDGTATVTVGTTELTDAEQLELADAVVSWTAIGLLVAGVGMILFAVGYVFVRHRAHGRTREDEPVSSSATFAVLGAFVTAVLSFVPFSPALGGALAGYLERGESDRTVSVGALAGLLPMLPLLVALLFVLAGLIVGLFAVEQAGAAIVVGATLFFVSMLVVTIGAGLGALGGYVGGRVAASRRRSD